MAPIGTAKEELHTAASAVDGRSSLRLRELAEPYRRRHLYRAANSIEHGILLPAGMLPEVVTVEDSSAYCLSREEFGSRAEAA